MVGQEFVKLVETFRKRISVQRICELMAVARTTYYSWRKQKGTQQKKNEIKMLMKNVRHINTDIVIVKSQVSFLN